MTGRTRINATVAAWIATLLGAAAAAILGVALVVVLMTRVDFGASSRSNDSVARQALAGVGVVAIVSALIALALAKQFCSPETRAARSLGGPVFAAILAFSVPAIAIFSDGPDLGLLWWVPLLLAPGLGAFIGTFVAVSDAFASAVTAIAAGTIAVVATWQINQP